MYRLSFIFVSLMFINSAPALAQPSSCVFTMSRPYTFTERCTGYPDITSHDVVIGRVVRGVIDVDMSHYVCLQMAVEVWDTEKWVLNIGNSPSNNGSGGDAGNFEHNSELEVFVPGATPGGGRPLPGFQTPGALNVYSKDPTQQIVGMSNFYTPGFIRRKGILNFEVGNNKLCASSGRNTLALILPPPIIIFNHNPDPDNKSFTGKNDTFHHIGFNRVVDISSNRVGQGVQKISIQLRDKAADCGCVIGP